MRTGLLTRTHAADLISVMLHTKHVMSQARNIGSWCCAPGYNRVGGDDFPHWAMENFGIVNCCTCCLPTFL